LVRVVVPSRTESDPAPIILFDNVNATSGDIAYPSISSGKDFLFKLDSNGYRSLNYKLNTPSISSSEIKQYNTSIDFGKLGPNSSTSVSMTVLAADDFGGDAGSKLVVSIVEDPTLHSTYAKGEVIDNYRIKLSVIETPYVVYNLIDAITANPKISEFVDFDISLLESAKNASTASTDWLSSVVGDFVLQGGSGSMFAIKDKEYEIQVLNIYNDEVQRFTVIPTVYSLSNQ